MRQRPYCLASTWRSRMESNHRPLRCLPAKATPIRSKGSNLRSRVFRRYHELIFTGATGATPAEKERPKNHEQHQHTKNPDSTRNSFSIHRPMMPSRSPFCLASSGDLLLPHLQPHLTIGSPLGLLIRSSQRSKSRGPQPLRQHRMR